MPRLPPSLRDTKSRVIRDAAYRLFLQDGFQVTSVDTIAHAAGVSKATLYARYDSKEALLSDVLSALYERGHLSAPVPDTPPCRTLDEFKVALKALSRIAVGQLMQPQALALLRLLISELPRHPQLSAVFSQAIPMGGRLRIRHLLATAQSARIIDFQDVELAERAFIGGLLSYVLFDGLLVSQPSQPTEAELNVLVDLYINGTRAKN